jgi:hypothetical protein
MARDNKPTYIERRPVVIMRLDTWEVIQMLTARHNQVQSEIIGDLLDKATAKYKQKERAK